MDALLSETAETNEVLGTIDQGVLIIGTQDAPVHIDDDIIPSINTKKEWANY
jgi:hypothetical protein